jgi:hypothetical protein
MGTIRTFEKGDVAQVALLHHRVWGASESDPHGLRDRESYLTSVFLENVTYQPTVASLVYEEQGKIVGFLGVAPRQMSFKGKSVVAAVASQFIVDPKSRSRMVGVQMVKAFFEGPQDLSISDEANDAARKLWGMFGGAPAFPYSFYWTRPIRPIQYGLSLVHRRELAALASAVRPFGKLLDAMATRLPFGPLRRPSTEAFGELISDEDLWRYFPEVCGDEELYPDYSLDAWKWVLRRAKERLGCGVLQSIVVRNNQKDVLGWYLYYRKHGGTSEVLQIAAKPQWRRQVLGHLLSHAWQGGAAALSGRLQPGWMQALSENHCFFMGGPWVLVASKKPELVQPFHQGNAIFSRCEGEWCLRYR